MHHHSLPLRVVLFGCLLVSGRLRTACGQQEAPFSNNDSDDTMGAAATSACGLIATTFDDPDWVMATSDRLLRLNLCLASPPCSAENWYDSPFKPCYSDNRFWKFDQDSEIAFAYPLASLGVGSFDSLYVRRNVKIQFFQGIGDSTPFGPELVGPQYVSITNWRDTACDGFEPNTFFVEGGPGALKDYSLKIGETNANLILSVDTKEEANEKDYHTDKYWEEIVFYFWDAFVLRRASTFTVEVKLAKEFSPNCHEILFEAHHNFDQDETIYSWGVEQGDITSNSLAIKSVELKISIPPDAPVGDYNFKVLVKNWSQVNTISEMQFDKKVTVIFNPWSSSDIVYYNKNLADLDEYVMKEDGIMYKYDDEAGIVEKKWHFDQFDYYALNTALYLLEGQPSTVRADAKLVSRYFSKMSNVQDDNGILWGKWPKDGDYSGGTDPSDWSGSRQILSAYLEKVDPNKKTVKYGQCWVFAGVLTTLFRSVGIPSRPVTNYNSGHDKNRDKILDVYFDTNHKPENKGDSLWNYHVWNENFLSGEWHVVDGTPQEESGDFYQLGPAPLSAIKRDSGGDYDVNFVFAEVHAVYREHNRRHWWPFSDYDDKAPDPTYVGRWISTKAVGSLARNDITSEYKTPGTTPRLPSLIPSVVNATFTAPSEVAAGSDINLDVTLLSNNVTDLNVRVLITESVILYDGTFVASLKEKEVFANLSVGASLALSLSIPAADYLNWTSVTPFFTSAFSVEVEGGEFMTERVSTAVKFPSPELVITPNTAILATNTDGMATFSFSNPLVSSIENVIVTFAVGSGLSLGDARTVDRTVGTLLSGKTLSIQQAFTTVTEGIHLMTVGLHGDKVADISASVYISTFSDCNSNGNPDSDDISNGSSQDCNKNEIPDECEADCNSNDVPDDCDISNDPLLDCNVNGLPDTCDVASHFSPDKNNNGVPDECDIDCNANETPDNLDIHLRVSSDFNHNGIPDECETDCNGNGVNDELDIAGSTSMDVDMNGVPDECENTVADCNGNGTPDSDDIARFSSADCNTNGVPDECDITSRLYRDCNSNGIPDECEPDCNGNGVPDDCDIDTGSSFDCNSNGSPDECDIATGSSKDNNTNGIPDECETSKPTTSKPTTSPTTSKPTTSTPTISKPTTSKPTTSKPTISKPTTSKPTTSTPTISKPTTSKPTTSKPTISKPTTSKPTTSKPRTSKPTTSKPATLKPTTLKPSTSKPTTSKPTILKPTTLKPTTSKAAKKTPAPITSKPTFKATKTSPTTKPTKKGKKKN